MLMETDRPANLKVVSFNMHGFFQGQSVLDDIINSEQPDVILVQEHWLTPHKLSNFEKYFADYFSFGSSAMASCTESGFLRRRPFGGVMSLINKNLRKNILRLFVVRSVL